MGRVASLYADFCFLTTDNPRKEDPQDIIKEIVSGFEKDNYEIEIDRFCAIEKAILFAKKDDFILIAGKGHEDYQIIGKERRFFDDRQEAALAAERHRTLNIEN